MSPQEFATHLSEMARQTTEQIKAAVQEESVAAIERMRQHFVPYQPWPAQRPVGKLFRRSGDMQHSLMFGLVQQRTATGSETTARFRADPIVPGVERALAVQEYGKANIHARFAAFMAIPLAPQLSARGVPRFSGAKGAHGYFDLFRVKRVLKGREKGTTGPKVPQFALRQLVSVPPRPVVTPEVVTAAQRLAARLAEQLVTVHVH